MDPHTFSDHPSGAVLVAILDRMPEEVGKRARSRVTTQLEDARTTVKLLADLPDRRIARYLLGLVRRESLSIAVASNFPFNVKTHLCCVLTGIFRDASKKLKSSIVKGSNV